MVKAYYNRARGFEKNISSSIDHNMTDASCVQLIVDFDFNNGKDRDNETFIETAHF